MNAVLRFCQLALDSAASLPPAERADCYEVAAHILKPENGPLADVALAAARELRNAEAAQLQFAGLLSAALN